MTDTIPLIALLEHEENFMNQEMQLLIQAIESLKQEGSIFKDYMFPLVSGFFSALLGAGVAYFTLRHQENIQIEKEKMNIINRWTLIADDAFSSLIAFKANYHGKLDTHPFQRVSQVPTILNCSKPIIEDFSALSFIAPKKDDKNSLKIKWRGIPRIRAMINNYNFALELWSKRNETERPIKEKLTQDYSSQRGYVSISREQIFESVGASNFISLIDLNERAIMFTDDLIMELNDFLKEFPAIGESLVNTKKLKRYGTILTFSSNENPILIDIIKKSPEVDYEVLSELFGQPAEKIKKEYCSVYENN